MDGFKFICALLIFSFGSFSHGMSRKPADTQGVYRVKQMNSGTGVLTYGVEYPDNFDRNRRYKVLLCLPGGSFTRRLAAYYNLVYTPSRTFQDYIKIYPISNNENPVLQFTQSDWRHYIKAIQDNENGNDHDWVISGASNGGRATFDIISASPETFRGFIVIPGLIRSQPLLEEWKDYDALVVYGEDESQAWITASLNTYNRLKNHVRAIELIKIPNVGHVLPITYNIEPIYKRFEDLSP